MEFADFQYSRVEIWQKGINFIFDNPLFGIGAKNFKNTLNKNKI